MKPEPTARDCGLSQSDFEKLKAVGDARRRIWRYRIREAVPWRLKPTVTVSKSKKLHPRNYGWSTIFITRDLGYHEYRFHFAGRFCSLRWHNPNLRCPE